MLLELTTGEYKNRKFVPEGMCVIVARGCSLFSRSAKSMYIMQLVKTSINIYSNCILPLFLNRTN